MTQNSKVYRIQPIEDPRWEKFLDRHPRSSIFHTSAWLEALRRTYDYEPAAYTTSPPDADLHNAIVFCRVNSWLTGRRIVSLPFSDHCEPLVDTEAERKCLLSALMSDRDSNHTSYLEIRSVDPVGRKEQAFTMNEAFCLHSLDIQPGLDQVFDAFDKDCVQRKIRRAHREKLNYEEGNSESLLRRFYAHMVLTRRRHRLPPQPIAWFRNLIASMGDKLMIRTVSAGSQPIASILTLRHKDTMVYKYAASDPTFHRLGGVQLLIWNTIQEAERNKVRWIDFGRSDLDNPGLINFKERWGACRSMAASWRYGITSSQSGTDSWSFRIARRAFEYVPIGVLPFIGNMLYRHIHRP